MIVKVVENDCTIVVQGELVGVTVYENCHYAHICSAGRIGAYLIYGKGRKLLEVKDEEL